MKPTRNPFDKSERFPAAGDDDDGRTNLYPSCILHP